MSLVQRDARSREAAIIGCLLGGAVGDAIGLPCERLSPRRIRALFGSVTGHRLVSGRGLISDDTEHAAMTARALIASRGEPDEFGRALAWQLRGWLLSLPPGAGLATLKACLKLCGGFGPRKSGVFSAGNGPAMRAAILGAWCDDLEQLRALVKVSTRLTHTDPKAERGALMVAMAAHLAARHQNDPNAFWLIAGSELVGTDEWRGFLELTIQSVKHGCSTPEFCAARGWERGVSGYILHTVLAALHASWRHPHNFRAAIEEAVSCGGDTDTVAAIVGGIVGAGVGENGIPREWIDGVAEFPRGVSYLRQLGKALASPENTRAPKLFWPVLPLRNALFLNLVLWHGFRRILPPYDFAD